MIKFLIGVFLITQIPKLLKSIYERHSTETDPIDQGPHASGTGLKDIEEHD